MLLILLNWILIFYVSSVIGFAVRRFLTGPSDSSEIAITSIWGMFVVSVVTTVLLFFVAAGIWVVVGFLLLAATAHFLYRREIRMALNLFGQSCGRKEIFSGSVLLFCLLVFSAQSSKINDDGLYYTQTVMWFTEEGFVKGISNLLLPLGLGSSWHVLQAVFSFDFLPGIRFNDLNGLLALLFFIFCMEHGVGRAENMLLAFLLAIALVLSVPFLSGCAPDFPVLVLTTLVFYLVTRYDGQRFIGDILLMCTFGALIKLSAVALGLLSVVLICYTLAVRIRVHKGIYFLVLVSGIAVICKNVYQTGYPFYPYDWFGFNQLSWTTPNDLLKHYTAGIKYWGLQEKLYTGPISEWHNPGIGETIRLLCAGNGYKAVVNMLILLSFPLILITILVDVYRRIKTKASFLLMGLHGIFVLNFLIWLVMAPQYRFILPVYSFYIPWTICQWLGLIRDERLRQNARFLPYLAMVVLVALSIYPVSLRVNTASRSIGTIDPFSFDRAITPWFSYPFPGVDTVSANGQNYYHVESNVYCWDSPLPCMSDYYYRFLTKQGFEIVGIRNSNGREFRLTKQMGR